MFEYLEKHDQIFVTGPQRSGTRIAAEMIASDLNRPCFREENILARSPLAALDIMLRFRHFVLQCPGLSFWIHNLRFYEEVAVVWMLRPDDEIAASEKRINWRPMDRAIEEALYREFVVEGRCHPEMPIAIKKLMVWNSYQKGLLRPRAYEIQFSALSEHKLWVAKEDRASFAYNETAHGAEPARHIPVPSG